MLVFFFRFPVSLLEINATLREKKKKKKSLWLNIQETTEIGLEETAR